MKAKKTVKSFVFVAFAIAVFSIVSNTSAFAADSTCAGVKTSILTCSQNGGGTCPDGSKLTATQVKQDEHCADGSVPSTLESSGLWGIVLTAINILTAGIGVAALGGIVYGAVLYTTAGGSQENIKKARTMFTNVIIGIIAYALMYSLLNFLIPGGLFT